MGYLLAVAGFFFIAYLLSKNVKKDDESDGVIVRDVFAKYIGGFSDRVGGVDAQIQVKQDAIKILFGGTGAKGEKTIPMDLVRNAEIKSENQISQEVILGRMLVLGTLAFALKKGKNKVKNYLVITCKKEEQEAGLVFESRNPELMVKHIREIKNIESLF